MNPEGAIEFEALETQAAAIMQAFVGAGYERVAPAFIQPASLFLDRIGETIRARTYVFSDANGEELCLRPDLTVPVCRIYLDRLNGSPIAKYCYNGPAFRIQEGKPDPLRPREFRQAGIEYFGDPSPAADLEVLELTLRAVRAAGVENFTLRLGHIGLFTALLKALSMPKRWRERLQRAFWRPQAFSAELRALSSGRAGSVATISPIPADEEELLHELDERGIAYVGLRRPYEVVKRLEEKAADASAPALPASAVAALEGYLRLEGSVEGVLEGVAALAAKAGADLGGEMQKARSLLAEAERLADGRPVVFEADFGRNFEYYTGMIFQIEIAGADVAGQIAGGGRYDGLIGAISAGTRDAPAAGAAIHTERLLAAVRKARR